MYFLLIGTLTQAMIVSASFEVVALSTRQDSVVGRRRVSSVKMNWTHFEVMLSLPSPSRAI